MVLRVVVMEQLTAQTLLARLAIIKVTVGVPTHLVQQGAAMVPLIELIRLVLPEIIRVTHGEQTLLELLEAIKAQRVVRTHLVLCVAINT